MKNPLLAALGVNPATRGPMVADFDWSARGIGRLYVIVTTGRSGSTWLTHLIDDTKLAGNPEEFFNDTAVPHYMKASGAEGAADYLDALVRTYSGNRAFGFKINPDRLFWLQDFLDVDAVFGRHGCRWFFMNRIDFVSQAYSFVKAKHSGKWHTYAHQSANAASAPALPDDRDWFDRQMWDTIAVVVGQEQRIWAYFTKKGIVPVCYSYEDMLADKRLPLLLTLRHIGVAGDYALRRIDGLADRTVKNEPESDSPRILDFVARYADPIVAIHRDRRGVDLHGLLRGLGLNK